MWATLITTVVTTVLPFLLKLIMMAIEKKQNNDKLKTEFLKFLGEIEHDVPTKLHQSYKTQIERLKAEINKSE